MSTNISTAFDAIHLKMDSLYTSGNGYVEITNPYNLFDNPVQAWIKGWGIAIGPATNTKRLLSCQISVQRQMSVVMTRASQGMELQTESKQTYAKELLEDQFILIKEMEKETSINSAASGITRFEFSTDDGIQFIENESEAFYQLTTVFEMEYFENLL